MNLTSHMEHHPYAFYTMSTMSATLALFVAWMGLRKYITSLSSRLYLTTGTVPDLPKSGKSAFQAANLVEKCTKLGSPFPCEEEAPIAAGHEYPHLVAFL
ncbi:hypothetical protein H0H81_004811 [Sphagnurus paluster]|uniref:Uncharacterized protein n=1 Tax=Sphagnurus paluster TaxID=117069 RepID=A0A9P7KJX8_9AGAR|nr:hypothetical protein H0H81_004811 [Sphagnurus paluster]